MSDNGSLIDRTAQQFIGHWVSERGEERPNAQGGTNYLKRDFTNTRDEAAATLMFFKDASYTDRTFTLVVSGPYRFVRPSAAVPGAVEADFSFTDMKITPHTPEFAGFLNSGKPGTCGTEAWKVDVQQSVKPTDGCAVIGVKLSEYREYDLVKVDGDTLYYGARPADGSAPDTPAKRPTALQVPLVRAK
jgi:hypothetical protein